jgi:thiopeptide-type bacteriocin biosynthesis protein
VQALRAELRLPRFIAVSDGDNDLPVDLDNVLSVETFVHLVKERRAVTLIEVFPGSDDLAVRGPEGGFAHELVIPFVRTAARPASDTPVATPPARSISEAVAGVARSFPPGSEWLYAKIYTGSSTADRLLRGPIAEVVRAALGAGAADRWFFIRYADPDFHLRVRFHGDPEALAGSVLPALHAALAPLIDRGDVWRVTLDTYERELERYGGDAIHHAEDIFFADSDATVRIVESLSGDAGATTRWRLALRGIDAMFVDLGFDLRARLALARRCAENYARDFGGSALFERQVGPKYREVRGDLSRLLDPAAAPETALVEGLAALAERSERIAPAIAALQNEEREGRLPVALTDLAISYVHMHVNRVLRSSQRAQEVVLYELLARLYDSQLARQGRTQA